MGLGAHVDDRWRTEVTSQKTPHRDAIPGMTSVWLSPEMQEQLIHSGLNLFHAVRDYQAGATGFVIPFVLNCPATVKYTPL